ncbi:hypothetical protein GMD70_23055, partial [Parabacteroides merdae]|nr:hypothetical protein [Parabacteroides merdae]
MAINRPMIKRKNKKGLYMNRKYDILSTALLSLLAGGCLLSCQQDDFGEALPDRETLITQGRYLTARSVDAVAASEDPD